MHKADAKRLGHKGEMQDQLLETLIPGIVTLEAPPDFIEEATNVEDATLIKGFQGIVRSISQRALTFDADVKPEKIRQRAKGELFITIPTAQRRSHLSFRVKPAWVKDHALDRSGRRCLVGLDVIPLENQLMQLNGIISEIREGRILYKEFAVDRTVYFGDTNVEGNVYFAKFFEWQGAAREEFYLAVMPDAIGFLKSGTRIITAEAKVQFKSQFVLFDHVTIEVRVSGINTANIDFRFLYKKKSTGILAAIGSQTLAFTNGNGQIIPVPGEVVRSLEPYFNPYSWYKTYL